MGKFHEVKVLGSNKRCILKKKILRPKKRLAARDLPPDLKVQCATMVTFVPLHALTIDPSLLPAFFLTLGNALGFKYEKRESARGGFAKSH